MGEVYLIRQGKILESRPFTNSRHLEKYKVPTKNTFPYHPSQLVALGTPARNPSTPYEVDIQIMNIASIIKF